MNTPVTHSECLKCREEIEKKFHDYMKEERVDFKEAVADIEAWVLRLEGQIAGINVSLENLMKELAIGMFLLFVAFIWGKI
jgi:hypothetical protein